jgi:hypothetical protein
MKYLSENIKSRALLMLSLLVAASLFVLLGSDISVQVRGQNQSLFFALNQSNVSESVGLRVQEISPAAVEAQTINVNFAALQAANSQEISFPLLDGQIHKAVRDEIEGLEMRGAEDFTWRGSIVGDKTSSVTLTIKNGILAGLIFAKSGVYEITPVKKQQVMMRLDQDLFPSCGGEISPPKNRIADEKISSPTATEDSGDRVDVIVVYTPAVKTALGGDAAAQTFAQQAIDTSNTSYRNSRVRLRLRLAHAQEINYTESGAFSADLSWIRSNTEAAQLRDTHKADLVDMLVNQGDACGIAYLMSNVSVGFAPNGYSVTARSCAVGNLSFPHELGHNMGSTHNPENGSGAAYPYAYGHYVDGSFRTVMSYSNPCTLGCTRVPYFSNPETLYNNKPTGIPDARDNSRSLNNTADTVANFRYSGSSLTLINPNGTETLSRNMGRVIRWSSDNFSDNVKIEISRDGGMMYETIFASTPNDGVETWTIRGPLTKQARLRISGATNTVVGDSSVNNFVIK